MAAMPTPDLAVPYEAPRQVKTMEAVQPMAPKKGCCDVSTVKVALALTRDRIGIGSRRRHRRHRHRGARCQPSEGALTA